MKNLVNRAFALVIMIIIMTFALGNLASAEECVDHTFSGWKVTTPATCKTEGKMTRTCTVCGEEVGEKKIADFEKYNIVLSFKMYSVFLTYYNVKLVKK